MTSQPDFVRATTSVPRESRAAYYAWGGGLLFTVVFTLLIWYLGPLLQPFLSRLLPDQGGAWYYWKLPTRDFWTMFIVWVFYLSHQFAIWIAIYWAQNHLAGQKSSSHRIAYEIQFCSFCDYNRFRVFAFTSDPALVRRTSTRYAYLHQPRVSHHNAICHTYS